MTTIVMWLMLAWGVDAGYEPTPDGHLEYIIQVEPQLLGSLAAGHDVTSEVPRGLDIRHYRLTVGTAVLPRIAPAAGQRPGAAGGATARAADQFETPGRVDEAVGTTTPQIRVGYQAISATGGQYVIEIDARSLADLNQADLTGDIPPGLQVTRFVISTNPGTAPSDRSARSGRAPTAPATLAAPPAVAAAPAAVDEDPSSWQAEPPAAAGSPPAGGGVPPKLAAEPTIPDDPPGRAVAPPAAMPPEHEMAEPPIASGQGNLDPRGGGFGHNPSRTPHTPENGPTAETSPALDTAPGHLPYEAASGPLVMPTAGVDDPDAEGHGHEARKHQAPAAATGDEAAPTPEPAVGGRKAATSDPGATKPWLPLTLTLLALFASLGGNVFLGWIAWESYTRDRPAVDRIERGKPSLSSHNS
jgi:hypothetical protein